MSTGLPYRRDQAPGDPFAAVSGSAPYIPR